MCLRMRSLREVKISQSHTQGSAQMVSCTLLLLVTMKLLCGHEGREGEAQPQLQFASCTLPTPLLCLAAKLCWTGKLAIEVLGAVTPVHPKGCSMRVYFTVCLSNSWAGMYHLKGPWTAGYQRQWAPAQQGSAGMEQGALVNTELRSQTFHLCWCQHWSLFAWPVQIGREPKPKSHLRALSTLALLGSAWKGPTTQLSLKQCLWSWVCYESISALSLAASRSAEGLSWRKSNVIVVLKFGV